MIRRIAFISGLILGSGLSALVLGSVLLYLFTGKLPALHAGPGEPPRVELVDVNALHQAPVVASSVGKEG